MISRIFSKTKPINFIIVISYLFLYTFIQQYLLSSVTLSVIEILLHIGAFILVIFTVFMVNYIDKRNTISKNNAYTLLFFSIGLSFFPQIVMDKNILLAHIFILLAMEKLLRIRNGIQVKQSIFDTAFWISMATLCYSWMLLYLMLLYIAILLYASKDYKNWVLPIIALLSAGLLTYTYFLWFQDSNTFLKLFSFSTEPLVFKHYPTSYIFPFAVLIILGFITIPAYIINTLKKRARKQSSFFLIIMSFLFGLNMVLFFGNTNKTTLIFMLFPISVLLTHYITHIKKLWLKESLFWILLLIPVIFLILQFTANASF